MRKFGKRMVVAILSAGMLAMALAGCGNSGDSAGGNGKPIEFMMVSDGASDIKVYMQDVFKEKFGVDVEFILNSSEAHQEKLKLYIASNEIPDIVSPFPDDQAKKVGLTGVLLPINEYLDQLPNMKKYLDQDPKNYLAVTASDNNIYSVPRFKEKISPRYTPIIRGDLLDEFGIEQLNTYDDLHQFLLQVKAKYPDISGIVNMEKMNFLNDFGTNFNTEGRMYYNFVEDKWQFGPTNEGFRELISYFNGLYADGLLDPDFFNAASDQFTEKIVNGKAAFFLSWTEFATTNENTYKSLHPEDTDFDLRVILPLTSKTLPERYVQKSENLGTWTSWGISADAPNMDTILKIVDYMYTDEGALISKWGEKDVHYIEENGKRKLAPQYQAFYNPDGEIDLKGTTAIGSDHMMRLDKNDNLMPEFEDATTEMLEVQYPANNVTWYELNDAIKLAFTEEEDDEIKTLSTNIDTMVSENALKFITGERPMSEFDAFVQQLKDAGSDRLEEIYAAAYDRYKEQMKQYE